MSHFYYIHKDVGGDKKFWKPGITVHPSNVVRGIQRKQSRKFVIDHLYFGRPSHICHLEKVVKHRYKLVSGKVLLEWGNQTELFKVNIDELLEFVDSTILDQELNIVKVKLEEPYHGTNQSNCSLQLPGENEGWWFEQRANELFGYTSQRTKIAPIRTTSNLFDDLFETS